MKSARAPAPPGSLRIIAGRWRGRRLPLPAGDALRPTPDRVRETLFNWLAPMIDGARCLDLFAGSGALGIEALSRGAAEAWFVERDPAIADALRKTLERLGAMGDRVVVEAAESFLSGPPKAFDVVFVDPPFAGRSIGNLCKLLDRGWLRPRARVYLEQDRADPLPELPVGWAVLREKTAGQVRYALAERG